MKEMKEFYSQNYALFCTKNIKKKLLNFFEMWITLITFSKQVILWINSKNSCKISFFLKSYPQKRVIFT